MQFYFNSVEKNFYITSNRNGSTLLKEISEQYDNLQEYSYAQVFSLLSDDPSIPLYVPFREPMVRFKSGLSVNLYNTVNYKLDHNTDEVLKNYSQFLKYFRARYTDTGSHLSATPNEKYHLYDGHLDHWLWSSMILGAYGYNIKLVPMYNFSGLLLQQFPKALKIINFRDRNNSFDQSTPLYEKIWESYKKGMVDDADINTYWPKQYLKSPEILYSFDNWMGFEKKLFTYYKDNYMQDDNKKLFLRLSLWAFEDPFYFTDAHSPRIQTICRFLLPVIHQYKSPVLRYGDLQNTFRNYESYFNRFRYKKYDLAERATFIKKDIL